MIEHLFLLHPVNIFDTKRHFIQVLKILNKAYNLIAAAYYSTGVIFILDCLT